MDLSWRGRQEHSREKAVAEREIGATGYGLVLGILQPRVQFSSLIGYPMCLREVCRDRTAARLWIPDN